MKTSWDKLKTHAAALHNISIANLFQRDKGRFQRFAFQLPGLLIDFSKNVFTPDILSLLLQYAEEKQVLRMRDEMFNGRPINTTENRAVLHTALRAPAYTSIQFDGKNVLPDIERVRQQMLRFAHSVRNGEWMGYNGHRITDIVNIGIGGSSLGPQFVTEALTADHHPQLRAHFVSNVEPSDLAQILKTVSLDSTLFIIASKTFSTKETMMNARIARQAVIDHYNGDIKSIGRHFVALSTNADAVKKFDILPENMFPFWDWVGGRYSVWSAIGLSSMIMIGPEKFSEFLAGAHAMDMHFQTAPAAENIPLLMGLIGIWNRNFLNLPAYAVIPYHSALKRMPAWMQQLDMESNGKSVQKDGSPVEIKTGPMLFGEPGTDAQHSFFQWLHQGTDIVPIDFIGVVNTKAGAPEQQTATLANLLAQAEGLMTGQVNLENPHRHFAGNRPSTMILINELSPFTLGMLMALYEHKVFVQGVIWGINSFDQFGVELGKVLAQTIETELQNKTEGMHDGSTLGLMRYIRDHKK